MGLARSPCLIIYVQYVSIFLMNKICQQMPPPFWKDFESIYYDPVIITCDLSAPLEFYVILTLICIFP